MWHETELVADGEGLVMSEKDDDRRLRCVATVDGLLSNVTVTTVAVRCQSQHIHRLYTRHIHFQFQLLRFVYRKIHNNKRRAWLSSISRAI